MVKASSFGRRRGAVFSALVVLGVTASCANIVGIEETTVESQAGAGASTGGSSGRGGAAGDGARAGTGGAVTAGASATGGSGGKGGSGGGTGGNATGGDATGGGKGGSVATAGSGGAAAGRGSTGGAGGSVATAGGSGTDATGGEAGASDACGGVTARCTNGVREVCTQGNWQTSACPLDNPTCSNGDCIVRGPKLIKAGSYYIDATEVTVADYAEFTAAKGSDTSGQPTTCSWNTSFMPAMDPGSDDLPVSYVNWCDAVAYCKWADKHLCSGIGGKTLTDDNLFDASASEWFQACGGGGTQPNDQPMCNTVDGNGDPVAVGTTAGCEGYYPGLFDMLGNVAEWVDLCDGNTGADDQCYLLGGSVIDSQAYCTADYLGYTRSATAYTFGFRCCSG